MKVNLGFGAHNSHDWDRVLAGDFSHPPATPDWECVQGTLAIADLAEPLGFDGIWMPEHCGTPYGMTPNPIQALSYFAGRTERVSLGTFVVVAPWWHPVRLAHQIAYLDILSNGRYTTIGIGRGVSKGEFDAVGVPREESRQRFNETLDILQLALSGERFSYEGEIFTVPEMSLRPEPQSRDLFSRIYSSSSTAESLEILARRGMVPLFVGNKPIEDAGREVQQVNTFRKEEGLPPCQPKNVMFMYCTPNADDAAKTEEWIWTANRDVTVHYGFADASNFKGVKGYEAYAAREAAATAVLASSVTGDDKGKSKTPGYHASNLLIGTPEEIFKRIKRRPGSVLVLRAHHRPAVRHHAIRGGDGKHRAVRQGGAARRPPNGGAAAPRGAPGERAGMTSSDCQPTETPDDIDIPALREKYRQRARKAAARRRFQAVRRTRGRLRGLLRDRPALAAAGPRADLGGHRRRRARRRLRRPAVRRPPEEGRRRRCPDHRAGRRLRRRLVLEPLSRHPVRQRILLLHTAARRARLHAEQEVRRRHRDLRALPAHRKAFRALRFRDLVHPGAAICGGTRRSSAGGSAPTATTTSGPGSWSWPRALSPAETAGHPGNQELQGAQLPLVALGLRLHRRRQLPADWTSWPTSASRSSAPAPPPSR